MRYLLNSIPYPINNGDVTWKPISL